MRARRQSPSEFESELARLKGRSAAVVYSFSPEATATKLWYDQWRSAVISAYGSALETLGIHPYYLDVTSFCRQALARDLPDMICAFNLNAGVTPITHWAVVPAVAAWCGIPPLPAEADVLLMGERKDIANLVAASCGFHVPTTYSKAEAERLADLSDLVVKPRDLGGSVGLRRTNPRDLEATSPEEISIIQEFVPGVDLTVPIVFQPTQGRYRAVAGVVYRPLQEHPLQWMHDQASKLDGTGYVKQIVEVPPELEERFVAFAAAAQLGPYSRLDLRLRAKSPDPDEAGFWTQEIAFMEVNPLPTLRQGINFLNVVASDPFRTAFRSEFEVLEGLVGAGANDLSLTLVLACALATLD
jgi:hypothetical protein